MSGRQEWQVLPANLYLVSLFVGLQWSAIVGVSHTGFLSAILFWQITQYLRALTFNSRKNCKELYWAQCECWRRYIGASSIDSFCWWFANRKIEHAHYVTKRVKESVLDHSLFKKIILICDGKLICIHEVSSVSSHIYYNKL